MQSRHAVHTMAGSQAQIRHAYLSSANYSHILNLACVTGETFVQGDSLPPVYLMNNLTKSRKQRIHHVHRPFFKRFTQNGMICISESSADYTPRVVPRHPFFIHQKSHKLRYSYGRMRIVYMNLHILRNIKHRQILLFMFGYYPLDCG